MLNRVPIWKLASSLKHLSIHLFATDSNFAAYSLNVARSVDADVAEDEFPTFRAPFSLRPFEEGEYEDNDAQHYIIACRCIVAAAKGGRLRSLQFEVDAVQEPFAMRSLIPAWVHVLVKGSPVDGFDSPASLSESDYEAMRWICAARWLRPTLTHASLWLPRPYSSPGENRHLQLCDIQAMLYHFKTSNFDDGTGRLMAEPYLSWFERDAELAQQVSDAWNTVVERGEADERLCSCSKCRSVSHSVAEEVDRDL